MNFVLPGSLRNMHANLSQVSDTDLTRVGRATDSRECLYVNPPIVRASTVLAGSLRAWRERAALPTPDKPTAAYARFGTPTTVAFESSMAELEGAHRALCFPSGLAACTISLMALAPPGRMS